MAQRKRRLYCKKSPKKLRSGTFIYLITAQSSTKMSKKKNFTPSSLHSTFSKISFSFLKTLRTSKTKRTNWKNKLCVSMKNSRLVFTCLSWKVIDWFMSKSHSGFIIFWTFYPINREFSLPNNEPLSTFVCKFIVQLSC